MYVQQYPLQPSCSNWRYSVMSRSKYITRMKNAWTGELTLPGRNTDSGDVSTYETSNKDVKILALFFLISTMKTLLSCRANGILKSVEIIGETVKRSLMNVRISWCSGLSFVLQR